MNRSTSTALVPSSSRLSPFVNGNTGMMSTLLQYFAILTGAYVLMAFASQYGYLLASSANDVVGAKVVVSASPTTTTSAETRQDDPISHPTTSCNPLDCVMPNCELGKVPYKRDGDCCPTVCRRMACTTTCPGGFVELVRDGVECVKCSCENDGWEVCEPTAFCKPGCIDPSGKDDQHDDSSRKNAVVDDIEENSNTAAAFQVLNQPVVGEEHKENVAISVSSGQSSLGEMFRLRAHLFGARTQKRHGGKRS